MFLTPTSVSVTVINIVPQSDLLSLVVLGCLHDIQSNQFYQVSEISSLLLLGQREHILSIESHSESTNMNFFFFKTGQFQSNGMDAGRAEITKLQTHLQQLEFSVKSLSAVRQHCRCQPSRRLRAKSLMVHVCISEDNSCTLSSKGLLAS